MHIPHWHSKSQYNLFPPAWLFWRTSHNNKACSQGEYTREPQGPLASAAHPTVTLPALPPRAHFTSTSELCLLSFHSRAVITGGFSGKLSQVLPHRMLFPRSFPFLWVCDLTPKVWDLTPKGSPRRVFEALLFITLGKQAGVSHRNRQVKTDKPPEVP